MSDENKGMTCPITGCQVKHILITTLVVFAVTFGFDWFYHGVLLMDAYEATASLWRSESEMQAMMSVCIFYHAVFSFGVAALYCYVTSRGACNGGCYGTGIRFGFLLGLILGMSHFASYIWMPIPLELALKWLAGGIAWGVITGYVLALVCGKLCKKS